MYLKIISNCPSITDDTVSQLLRTYHPQRTTCIQKFPIVKGKGVPRQGEVAQGVPVVNAPDFLDFPHYEGGKVVTLTHRPSLPPGSQLFTTKSLSLTKQYWKYFTMVST
jgi:hypothetical protein